MKILITAVALCFALSGPAFAASQAAIVTSDDPLFKDEGIAKKARGVKGLAIDKEEGSPLNTLKGASRQDIGLKGPGTIMTSSAAGNTAILQRDNHKPVPQATLNENGLKYVETRVADPQYRVDIGDCSTREINGRAHYFVGFGKGDYGDPSRLQAAIDDALKTGGTVIVKEGRYSGFSLRGKGGISIYGGFNDEGVRDIYNTPSRIMSAIDMNGVRLSTELNGFYVYDNSYSSCALWACNTSNITIANNIFDFPGGSACGIYAFGTSDLTVKNNYFTGGFGVATSGANGVIISGNTFRGWTAIMAFPGSSIISKGNNFMGQWGMRIWYGSALISDGDYFQSGRTDCDVEGSLYYSDIASAPNGIAIGGDVYVYRYELKKDGSPAEKPLCTFIYKMIAGGEELTRCVFRTGAYITYKDGLVNELWIPQSNKAIARFGYIKDGGKVKVVITYNDRNGSSRSFKAGSDAAEIAMMIMKSSEAAVSFMIDTFNAGLEIKSFDIDGKRISFSFNCQGAGVITIEVDAKSLEAGIEGYPGMAEAVIAMRIDGAGKCGQPVSAVLAYSPSGPNGMDRASKSEIRYEVTLMIHPGLEVRMACTVSRNAGTKGFEVLGAPELVSFKDIRSTSPARYEDLVAGTAAKIREATGYEGKLSVTSWGVAGEELTMTFNDTWTVGIGLMSGHVRLPAALRIKEIANVIRDDISVRLGCLPDYVTITDISPKAGGSDGVFSVTAEAGAFSMVLEYDDGVAASPVKEDLRIPAYSDIIYELENAEISSEIKYIEELVTDTPYRDIQGVVGSDGTPEPRMKEPILIDIDNLKKPAMSVIRLVSLVNRDTGVDLYATAVACLKDTINPDKITLASWGMAEDGSIDFAFRLRDGSLISVRAANGEAWLPEFEAATSAAVRGEVAQRLGADIADVHINGVQEAVEWLNVIMYWPDGIPIHYANVTTTFTASVGEFDITLENRLELWHYNPVANIEIKGGEEQLPDQKARPNYGYTLTSLVNRETGVDLLAKAMEYVANSQGMYRHVLGKWAMDGEDIVFTFVPDIGETTEYVPVSRIDVRVNIKTGEIVAAPRGIKEQFMEYLAGVLGVPVQEVELAGLATLAQEGFVANDRKVAILRFDLTEYYVQGQITLVPGQQWQFTQLEASDPLVGAAKAKLELMKAEGLNDDQLNFIGITPVISDIKDDIGRYDVLFRDHKGKDYKIGAEFNVLAGSWRFIIPHTYVDDSRLRENEAVTAAKKDLCERLGIAADQIGDFSYEVTSSIVCHREPPIIHDNLKVGLVYNGQTYIYEGRQTYDSIAGNSGSAKFTGLIIPVAYDEKGNLVLKPVEMSYSDVPPQPQPWPQPVQTQSGSRQLSDDVLQQLQEWLDKQGATEKARAQTDGPYHSRMSFDQMASKDSFGSLPLKWNRNR